MIDEVCDGRIDDQARGLLGLDGRSLRGGRRLLRELGGVGGKRLLAAGGAGGGAPAARFGGIERGRRFAPARDERARQRL